MTHALWTVVGTTLTATLWRFAVWGLIGLTAAWGLAAGIGRPQK